MKVLNFNDAADRIAWERSLKLGARRDDILSSVADRLHSFAPNTLRNIKHPLKPNDRFALRAWCPLHDGLWVRLIVRADDDGRLTFECAAGCSEKSIRDHIGLSDVGLRKENLSLSKVIDLTHRFENGGDAA